MTWILIIGTYWAITGYKTHDDCVAAAKQVQMRFIMQCVPMPEGGGVVQGLK